MIFSVLVSFVTCILMLVGVLKFPKISLGIIHTDSYWVITLLGALVLILTGQGDISFVWQSLTADTAINPIKILTLFVSMTVLSIFLDEMGLFRFLASWVLSHAKTSQKKLFVYLYLIVSVLTVFTSNDVIILSFTPFICYFAKNAKINPIPYLAAEFVAANTWSMALIIGNPTNIYLASAYGIGFAEYVGKMLLPTLVAGSVALFALYLSFGKMLNEEMQCESERNGFEDKVSLAIGIAHLATCTVMLAISSYVGIEMYKVALCCVISLFVCVLVASAIRRKSPKALGVSLLRAPWQLIPFVLSMFVMILVLDGKGATAYIADALGESFTVFGYGFASFFSANVINNIPMSVLFCSVIENLTPTLQQSAVYATVIGSNIGAFLSPIGALAGIMWSSILSMHGAGFYLRDFLRMGVKIAIPTMCASLLALSLVM